MNTKKMRQQIINCAQRLLQKRGYHGWSYQDISNQIGIRKATIHYYFPFKENLGEAALADYYNQLFGVLQEIEKQPGSNEEKLKGLIGFMSCILDSPNLYCLLGMLAADLPTLSEKVQQEVHLFIQKLEEWVLSILQAGAAAGEWKGPILPIQAKALVASLEGMLLIARAKGGKPIFLEMADRLIVQLQIV